MTGLPSDEIGLMLYLLFGMAIAASLGSFLGLCAVRFPASIEMQTGFYGSFVALGGRSRCDSCGYQLGVADLIPLLSWLVLRGYCRRCQIRIDPIQPAIEASAVLAFLIASLTAGSVFQHLALTLLGAVLTTLMLIDLRHLLLPDALVVVVAGLGLVVAAVSPLPELSWFSAILGVIELAAITGAIAWGYRHWRGWDGLGGGDIKLAAALGSWVGYQQAVDLLLIASVGTLVIALICGTRKRTETVPLGPGLVVAALLLVQARLAEVTLW